MGCCESAANTSDPLKSRKKDVVPSSTSDPLKAQKKDVVPSNTGRTTSSKGLKSTDGESERSLKQVESERSAKHKGDDSAPVQSRSSRSNDRARNSRSRNGEGTPGRDRTRDKAPRADTFPEGQALNEVDTTSGLLDLRADLCKLPVDARAEALTKSAADPRVKTLYLEQNKLGDAEALLVAQALSGHRSLCFLGLGDNTIGDDGVRAIADAVSRTSAPLANLGLSNNAVGDAGACLLAGALEKSAALEVLDLRGNKIGPAGAARLSQAVQRAPRLRKLKLGENAVGDAGARDLAAALQRCEGLEELALESNGITDIGCKSIVEALEAGCNLRTLLLRGNQLSDNSKRRLRDVKGELQRRGCFFTVVV